MDKVMKSKKVVLKVPGDSLRKIIEKLPASGNKKRKQTVKGNQLQPHSGKTGTKSKTTAIAKSERIRQLKAARSSSGRVRKECYDKEYRAREAEAVQRAALYWSTITDSDDEALEWAELLLNANTPPIPILIRKTPDLLTNKDRDEFAYSEYLKQALQHKLQLPTEKFGITSQIQQAYQTVAMERIEAFAKGEPLAPVPITRLVPSLDVLQFRPRLELDQAEEVSTDDDQILPILPPPDINDLLYQTPPLQYMEIPDQPPKVGQYNTEDYRYHYAATIHDNTVFSPASRPRDGPIQTQFSMMALNNLRQFDENSIDPHLLIGTPLTTSLEDSGANSNSLYMPHDSTHQGSRHSHVVKQTFQRTQLLAEMRYEARAMYEMRRGRKRAASFVAKHCEQEAQWREQSRGRFVPGNGTFLMHEPRPLSDNPLEVLAEAAIESRGGLGYQRDGIIPAKDEKGQDIDKVYEKEKWRTAEEWREVVRTGGVKLEEKERIRLGFLTEDYSITSVPEQGVSATLALDGWVYDSPCNDQTIVNVVADHIWGGVKGYVLQEPHFEEHEQDEERMAS